MNLREKIRFYLIDSKTIPGKLLDIAIFSLNILICLLFVIETYPISQALRRFLWTVEIIIILLLLGLLIILTQSSAVAPFIYTLF